MEFVLLTWVEQSVFLVLKQRTGTIKCFHSNPSGQMTALKNAIVYGDNWTISDRGRSESLASPELSATHKQKNDEREK